MIFDPIQTKKIFEHFDIDVNVDLHQKKEPQQKQLF